jgi:hypothetical protein
MTFAVGDDIPGVDPVRRDGVRLVHRHVGGREAQPPAAAVTALDDTGDLVRAAKNCGRPGHVSRRDAIADER